MTRFEPGSSDVGCNRSAKCATTIAIKPVLYVMCLPPCGSRFKSHPIYSLLFPFLILFWSIFNKRVCRMSLFEKDENKHKICHVFDPKLNA